MPLIIFVIFANILPLRGQDEYDYLFDYRSQGVKSIDFQNVDLEVFPSYEYQGNKIIQHHPASQMMWSCWDTIYAQGSRVDSICSLRFDLESYDAGSVYERKCFEYENQSISLIRTVSDDGKVLLEKYVYGKKGRLESIIAHSIEGGDTLPCYTFKFKYRKTKKTLNKTLISGKHDAKKITYVFDRKGRVKKKTITYNIQIYHFLDGVGNGDKSHQILEYKYNAAGLIEETTATHYFINPEGKLTHKMTSREIREYHFY